MFKNPFCSTLLAILLSLAAWQPFACAINFQETKQDVKSAPMRIADLPGPEALRQARLLFIRPRSSFFNKEKLERKLLKRKEFNEMGLEMTRSISNADLVLEITRKRLTTRFTCNVIEPITQRVLAGTTASSLGGEIEPNLADAIVKELKAKRAKQVSPTTEVKKPE